MGSTRKRGIGVALLAAAAAVVAAPPAPADAPPPAAELAARICTDVFARIGFVRFQQHFRSPEDCAAEVAHEAAAVLADCGNASDADACTTRRVGSIVGSYVGDEAPEGGVYTTASGAPVRVLSSGSSGLGDADRRSWAEFLGGLVHGDELAQVTLRLTTAVDVRSVCGPSALACYLPTTETIVASPADQPLAPDAESLVAHEYGHHVANNRSNAPWPALERGTKRWATHLRVCQRVRSGELVTRALWGRGYRLSPAEGFAEAYRLLNEQRLGSIDVPRLLVDERFRPDPVALRALERDIVEPWREPTTISFTGRGSRSFRFATPLDGALRTLIAAPLGSAYRVSAPSTVCGRRSVVVRVHRLRGSGPFRLTVWRP